MNNLKANKLHIGIFGKRNAGKSTLMNVLLKQDFSIVSNTPGTTTDVNQKSVELESIGPVVLLDTAGIDDINELGQKRVEKTYKALKRVDLAIVVCDYEKLTKSEIELLEGLKKDNIPFFVIVNKNDVREIDNESLNVIKKYTKHILKLSIKNDKNSINTIRDNIISLLPSDYVKSLNFLSDFISPSDIAVLVVPIDKEAPKDRLILPQVQTIRNLLDNMCITVLCDPKNLSYTLSLLKKIPKVVITDSQAFREVSKVVPNDILLTSFSIIFAHFKGDIKELVLGANKIDYLKDNDKILICESCTHHPVEDDIGRVKIPNLIEKFTSRKLIFEHYGGYDFPENLNKYSLIIHCGACMTNRSEMMNRINEARINGIPITNYGITIAKCLGILPRSIQFFEKIICFD